MAERIKELVDGNHYGVLQQKVNTAAETIDTDSDDDKLNKLCEVLELTGKVQHEVFSVINQIAESSESEVMKSRLLPWMSKGFLAPNGQVSNDTSLKLIKEKVEKEKELDETMRANEKTVNALDLRIATLEAQLAEEQNKTAERNAALEAHKLESAGTLNASEEEILSLRKKLSASKLELKETQTRLDQVGDYDRQIAKLRSEVRLLTLEKRDLIARIDDFEYIPYIPIYPRPVRYRSPSPVRYRSPSPTRAHLTNDIRANRLITRYSTLFSHDRMSIMDTLRRYVAEEEMVRRIIYIATIESFHSAKAAFRQFKERARKMLLPIHVGPETLDEACTDYIVRNLDLYDIETSVREVTKQMNSNPVISYPAECDFTLLNYYIRECARIAFEMQAVNPRIDLAHAVDGELFNEKKYRRSYDSEYSAPLVAYYIWPALMDGTTCVSKGEAFTKRGALLHTARRSRSPSPRRGRSPQRRLT